MSFTRAVKAPVKAEDYGKCEETNFAYDANVLHRHCENCYNRFCDISNKSNDQFVCEMIDCDMNCGQRLHSCKLTEHKQVCQQEKVSCPNEYYGCPVDLLRSKISSHIKVCPASVIQCVIEWNRWPMHSQEEKIKASLPLNNPHVKCKQLDVALALRDQRMLLKSMKAPRRVHKIFQNTITKKYPSVPFGLRSDSFDSDSEVTSLTVSDDENEAPWENSMPPGLKSSVCSRLYQASESLANSINAMTTYIAANHDVLDEIAEEVEQSSTEDDVVGSSNGKTLDPDSISTPVLPESNVNNVNDVNSDQIQADIFHKKQMFMAAKDQNVSRDIQANISDGSPFTVGGNCSKNEISLNGFSTDGDHDEQKMTGSSQKTEPAVCQDLQSTNKKYLIDEEIYKKDIKLHELLGVSLTVECISKYIPKPVKMYTFLCAQDFRREEYTWHFKNVHNDIHCGLNGYLEQRCPLAYQGCNFSYHRLTPCVPEGRIVHSSMLESFGLLTCSDDALNSKDNSITNSDIDVESNNDASSIDASSMNTSYGSLLGQSETLNSDLLSSTSSVSLHGMPSSDCVYNRSLREATPEIVTSHKFDSKIKIFPRYSKYSCDVLIDSASQRTSALCILNLPFEVLQYIATFLDGFSLNNLSLSCKVLRNVSCAMLVEKGMVMPVWEKRKSETGQRSIWELSYKKWCFSTSFSPVYKWNHNGQGPMLDHLKICPYNKDENKNIQSESWRYEQS